MNYNGIPIRAAKATEPILTLALLGPGRAATSAELKAIAILRTELASSAAVLAALRLSRC
jgi:hypothetical protein